MKLPASLTGICGAIAISGCSSSVYVDLRNASSRPVAVQACGNHPMSLAYGENGGLVGLDCGYRFSVGASLDEKLGIVIQDDENRHYFSSDAFRKIVAFRDDPTAIDARLGGYTRKLLFPSRGRQILLQLDDELQICMVPASAKDSYKCEAQQPEGFPLRPIRSQPITRDND